MSPFYSGKWLVRWMPAIVMCVVASLVLLAISLSVAQSSRESQAAVRAAQAAKRESKSNGEAVAILNDCLHPPGKCFERSKANEQKLLAEVGNIQGRVGVYVWLCGHQPGLARNLPGLTACVETMIKEHGL